MRLYPVPFRTMPEASKFSKWQWVEADVVKASNDPRRESFKVDTSTMTPLGSPMPAGKGWPERWVHVAGLVQPSMCALDKLKPTRTSPSLALIKPVEWELLIEDLPPDQREWTPQQRANLIQQEGTADMFGSVTPTRGILEKIPVKFSYRFRCADAGCKGHTKLFEDWEICQSWRDWQHKYPDRAGARPDATSALCRRAAAARQPVSFRRHQWPSIRRRGLSSGKRNTAAPEATGAPRCSALSPVSRESLFRHHRAVTRIGVGLEAHQGDPIVAQQVAQVVKRLVLRAQVAPIVAEEGAKIVILGKRSRKALASRQPGKRNTGCRPQPGWRPRRSCGSPACGSSEPRARRPRWSRRRPQHADDVRACASLVAHGKQSPVVPRAVIHTFHRHGRSIERRRLPHRSRSKREEPLVGRPSTKPRVSPRCSNGKPQTFVKFSCPSRLHCRPASIVFPRPGSPRLSTHPDPTLVRRPC